jgi:hypothetical protein
MRHIYHRPQAGGRRTAFWHSRYALHTVLIVMQKADRLIFPAPFIDVLASLFLDEYDGSPSNLNLIVPHEKFFTMDIFLRKLAGYVTAERQMEAHSSVTALVACFVRYRKSHLAISLTQAGVIAR